MSKQLTKEQAIKFYESGVWEDMTARQLVDFQLFQDRLCVPFGEFQKAVETVFNRPVYTHEFSTSNRPSLIAEFYGKKDPPTFEEIIAPIKDRIHFINL